MIELGRLVCSVRDCEAHPILACSVKFFCQEHADIHLRDETKKLYRSQKKENAAHPPRLCPGVGDDSKHFTESLKDAMMIRKKVATTAISIRWAKESEVSDAVEGTEQQASGSGRDLLVESGSGREGPDPDEMKGRERPDPRDAPAGRKESLVDRAADALGLTEDKESGEVLGWLAQPASLLVSYLLTLS